MTRPGAGGGSPAVGRNRGATMRQARVRLFRWIGRLASAASLLAWMGVIFHLSSLSPSGLPHQLEAFSWLGKLRDVVGHMALYGVLGTLAMVALAGWVAGSTRQARWALLAAGLGVLYGVLDEYHQSFVPGRSASAIDVLVDGVGVTLGLACAWYAVRMVAERRLTYPFGGWTWRKRQG
ncbi:MAG: VanZ family protein [Chloroflexota bacterium]